MSVCLQLIFKWFMKKYTYIWIKQIWLNVNNSDSYEVWDIGSLCDIISILGMLEIFHNKKLKKWCTTL